MTVHDIAIRGGTVVDGSGGPSRVADVGVTDGVIREIGPRVTGRTELDAQGSLVTPGFIDIHTHFDAQVFWDPALTPSSLHGVTTVASGSCGFSLAPCRADMRDYMLRTMQFVEDMDPITLTAGIEWGWETFTEYLQVLARTPNAINYGCFVGHTAVRLFVLGEEAYERTATPDEVARMRAVVAESITGGALGFSTDRSPYHKGIGGRPVPSTVGTEAELIALLEVTRDLGRGTCMAIVDPDGFEWVFDLQPALGRPFTWCQMTAWPTTSQWKGVTATHMARQAQAAAVGQEVFGQASAKPVSAQLTFANPMSFSMLPAFAELLGTESLEGRRALYLDGGWRQRARHEFDTHNMWTRWDKIIVAETTTQSHELGRTVAELAAARSCHPLDAALDLALADDLQSRFTVIIANDDPDELTQILRTPGCVLGLSDAGAHCDQTCDANMLTTFLAHWVRDRRIMRVEEGIRKLTSEPARVLGLGRERGLVAEGMAADLVVLELERLDPGPVRRVWDFPLGRSRLTADEPQGFRHVLVNGGVIRRDGEVLALEPHERRGVLVTS
jgi:N-acyl-D-aspartate/D-glutamate deacylase